MQFLRCVLAATAILLAGTASAQSPWGPPARQVWATTNDWSFIPGSKTNVQLVFDWLDDKLVWSGAAWTNLPSGATNSLQNLFDWLDINVNNVDVSNEVAAAFPYLDEDYRDDITNIAFGSSGSTNWTFAKTNGTGYVGYPQTVGSVGALSYGEYIGTMVRTGGYQAATGSGAQTMVVDYHEFTRTNAYTAAHSLSSGRLYLPTSGVYLVVGSLVLQDCEVSFASQADVFFRVNGVTDPLKFPYVSAYDDSTQVGYSISQFIYVENASSYVQLGVFGEWTTCGGTGGVPQIVYAELGAAYVGQ